MTTSTPQPPAAAASTYTVARIRQSFLDFFASKGHTVVASSPLVPGNDPTLMFTNSGMVQFKDVFLGTDKRPYVRATSVQACLRAGGKHNDLENVGYTARHHTFFEMLGNWSFGDYFKRESLKWGWELLTEVYQLPKERLWATVYAEDDEAYAIWRDEIGLPPERIVRIGDNKGGRYKSDNFWMMADTGPCGPCSEIFYDHGEGIEGGPPGSPNEDGDRYIEIWNHVFMQFEMHENGTLTPLPAPCVDTGMGLERLAAVLQHAHSNYEIDLFSRLIQAAATATGCTDLKNPSLKVIADHIRATAFLISDGVLPGADGRSYVERRIIRRAIRHGYKLGQTKPFFHLLVAELVALMGQAYPRLAAQQESITKALKAEEERFFETLAKGMEILDGNLGAGEKTLEGAVAFKLHDTYGFPLDLTQDVCRERGVSVDGAGFERAMQQQKDNARAAGKFKMNKLLAYEGADNAFTGYDELKPTDTRILAIYRDGEAVATLAAGEAGVLVLETTPFYAESGGQIGDSGSLGNDNAHFVVSDTQKIKATVFGHHGQLERGSLSVGESITAAVDTATRLATARNHSATHLMHHALRQVLGSHVGQKGSLVNNERTRFDFTHPAPVTAEEIIAIEQLVNAQILANTATHAEEMPIDAAQNSGAMMLFGEKYGETVRVLGIGESRELCGGTHATRTGDIGVFKILSETGIASGVRRIEAVTALTALAHIQAAENTLAQLGQTLKTTVADLPLRTAQLQEHSKTLEKENAALKTKLALAQAVEIAMHAQMMKDGTTRLLLREIAGADTAALRTLVEHLRDKIAPCVIVLGAQEGGKTALVAGISKPLCNNLKSGELIAHIAPHIGGKGGGKPELAMAGGGSNADGTTGIALALQAAQEWVASKI